MNVLFFVYHFPPVGGGGAQRTVKFVKYLPEFDIRPGVLTGPSDSDERWLDEGLGADLPAGLPVFRPDSRAPASYKTTRLDRILGRPGAAAAWWRSTVAELGETAIERFKPDVLVATLPPYETLDPVLELGSRHGIPVVADLRDPWVLDEGRSYPSGLHRALDRRSMRRQLGRASWVVMNTPEAHRAMREELPGEIPISAITNGYDEADFEPVDVERTGHPFTILHAGGFHYRLAVADERMATLRRLLRARAWDVDVFGRSHHYLLQALAAIRRDHPRRYASLRVQLAGSLYREDADLIERSDVADIIEPLGYLPHDETVHLMRSADALFFPHQGVPAGERSRIVPGKLYEYLAARRPILAAIPPGDARDFIGAADAGIIVEPDDVEGIASAILTLMSKPQPDRPLSESVTRFTRRRLTAELAEVLRQVAGA